MVYRPDWWDGIAGGRGVAQIAIDVHSTCCGSMERSDEEQEQDVRAIRWVVENWQNPSKGFDRGVRGLLESAIHEHDRKHGIRYEVRDETGVLVPDCDHASAVGFAAMWVLKSEGKPDILPLARRTTQPSGGT